MSATYVHGKLGTAKVAASNIESTRDLPLGLGLLDFTSSGEIDSPAIVVEGLALTFEGHLVVGEGVGSGAIAMVDLQLALSLGLFALFHSIFAIYFNLVFCLLDLPLHVEVLQKHSRESHVR